MTGFGLGNLRRTAAAVPAFGTRDVLVRVGAVSLNFKDLLLVDGRLAPNLPLPFVPTSDAVGEVVAIGAEVTRFKVGDRVLGQVIADWPDGDPPPVLHKRTLGASLPGVLATHAVFAEDAAVLAPPSLTDAEASTLPIAALTAWSALVEAERPLPGRTVLIEGTGGVALFALQFAVRFGLKTIVTSRSDQKLEQAKMLGAWGLINSDREPQWASAARTLTSGRGVDHVLELVGGDNVGQAVDALAPDGRLSIIGQLAGTELKLPVVPLTRNRIVLAGISVGSRRAFERMNEAIEFLKIKPVVEAIYPFAEAPAALEHQRRGAFGKIVIGVE